jgi:sugar lactone lactonase YvrE
MKSQMVLDHRAGHERKGDIMRRKIITCLLAGGALLGANLAQPVEARGGDRHDTDRGRHRDRDHRHDDDVFADGGVLAGSTNGISFAPDGTLYVANVFGSTITQIDPESGEILSRLTAADGVLFPDDVFVAPDGTIYWTEIALGNVFKKPVGEAAFPLIMPFGPPPTPPGLNSANPLVLTDEAEPRLFAAGCYGGPPLNNSFVEIDPSGALGITNVIFGPVADCASNGMSWYDKHLYSPQPFKDEIWRINPDVPGGDPTPVTTGWSVPIGTAFDADGNLYALAQGAGEVVKIDISNTDTENNRTVLAKIPVGWADNIAVDKDGDVFISSATDSTIAEVLDNGKLRIVVPGQFQMTLGVSVIGKTLYTTNSSQIVGFSRKNGKQTSNFRAPFGFGYPFALSSIAWGRNLVLMSAFNGDIVLWDPVNNVPLAEGPLIFPIDAQPFKRDLIVTTGAPTGDIYRLSKDLTPTGGPIASVPGATGVAAKGRNVYVADGLNGTILQIIKHNKVLATPVVVYDGLSAPEGIDIKGNVMYVVEGGTQSLTRINMKTGKRKTIATDLGLQDPFLLPYGYLNNVTVAGNDIYVNADRANVIYEFDVRGRHHRHR